MARRIPPDRFDQIVDAATEVFISRGFRQTQMSDVAEVVGVAKGTLYGYVESKDALFVLCMIHADRQQPLTLPRELPVPTPRRGELRAQLKQRTANESVPKVLERALSRGHAEDPHAEFEAVIREFYATLERNCRAIKLIDRCTDHPELRTVWQTEGREAPRAALVRYLEMRMQAGQLRPMANVKLAARLVIEVCVTWAIHIKWDRSPEPFDPDEARENAIAFLVSALAR